MKSLNRALYSLNKRADKTEDTWAKLDVLIELFGEKELLSEIIISMSKDEVDAMIDWIVTQHDIHDPVFGNVDDEYDAEIEEEETEDEDLED